MDFFSSSSMRRDCIFQGTQDLSKNRKCWDQEIWGCLPYMCALHQKACDCQDISTDLIAVNYLLKPLGIRKFFVLIPFSRPFLIRFLSLFSGVQGIFLLSSLLQIHNCFELLPLVSLPAVSMLKMCGILDAGPCRSLVIFYTVLFFFQWLCGFCWICL